MHHAGLRVFDGIPVDHDALKHVVVAYAHRFGWRVKVGDEHPLHHRHHLQPGHTETPRSNGSFHLAWVTMQFCVGSVPLQGGCICFGCDLETHR